MFVIGSSKKVTNAIQDMFNSLRWVELPGAGTLAPQFNMANQIYREVSQFQHSDVYKNFQNLRVV